MINLCTLNLLSDMYAVVCNYCRFFFLLVSSKEMVDEEIRIDAK